MVTNPDIAPGIDGHPVWHVEFIFAEFSHDIARGRLDYVNRGIFYGIQGRAQLEVFCE